MKSARTDVLAVAWMLIVTVAAGAQSTRPAEETPWGQTVDGLACRLILKPTYCQGEPLGATVEVRNVSKAARLILDRFGIEYTRHAKLALTGPDGRAIRQRHSARGGYGPQSWTPIAAGETRRIALADLGAFFGVGPVHITRPGKYTATYTYNGKTPSKEMIDPAASAWAGRVVSNTATFTVTAPTAEDLTVHEWGIFTVYPDAEHANTGRRAEWASLPAFFYRQFPTVRLRWSPAMWDKPIVYFHSKRESLAVRVKVDFAKGFPVLWWPACSEPLDMGPGAGRIPQAWKKGKTFRSLTWSATLGKVVPRVFGPGAGGTADAKPVEPEPFEMPEDCWLTQARAVRTARPVTVMGSNVVRGRPWTTDRQETERFLFYDGLVPAPDFLRCANATERSATLKNTSHFAIAELFLVDNRGDPRRFAHVTDPLKAGEPREIALAASGADAASPLVRKALLAAGLFADEADALLKIWHDGLFRRPGLTAFYVLPRAEYDRMLPMEITPAPGGLLRVGIAVHPHFGGAGALAERAAALVKRLDADAYAVREAAGKALAEMAAVPAVAAVLRKAAATGSAEVRQRCREILEYVDGVKPAK